MNVLARGIAFLRKPFDIVEQTMTEANYHSDPQTIWSLLFPKKTAGLPETPSVAVGQKMIGTSRMVGTRYIWAAAFAALTIKTLAVAAVCFGAVGAGLIAIEYTRARQSCREVIDEVNFAGQRVRGTRSDLCRLHQAQMQVMNLGASFKLASQESTHDTIRNIIESVADARARVRVVNEGPYGATGRHYEFSRPQITLVSEEGYDAGAEEPVSIAIERKRETEIENKLSPAFANATAQPQPAQAPVIITDAPAPLVVAAAPATLPQPASKPLHASFASRMKRDRDIVEQLAAIEQTLTHRQRSMLRQKLRA